MYSKRLFGELKGVSKARGYVLKAKETDSKGRDAISKSRIAISKSRIAIPKAGIAIHKVDVTDLKPVIPRFNVEMLSLEPRIAILKPGIVMANGPPILAAALARRPEG